MIQIVDFYSRRLAASDADEPYSGLKFKQNEEYSITMTLINVA